MEEWDDGIDFGYDFEESVSTTMIPEKTPRIPGTQGVKIRLTGKGKKSSTHAVVREGSALGELPSAIVEELESVPVMDILVGKTIDLNDYGTVSINALIYDEAVESKLFLANQNGRNVIVKIFMPKKKGEFSELEHEIAALRDLETVDQVVRLLYSDDRTYRTRNNKQLRFCILELLHVSLHDYMELISPGGLPLPLIGRIAVQAVNALEALHERNYVHGDVGIGNIMFTDDSLENLKLIDFGYARKYRLDGVHVDPGHNPLPPWSRSLLSISELDEHFPSRRDDMFRLGENLLKLLNSDYQRMFKSSKVDDIRNIKASFIPTLCCSRATTAFDQYFEHVRQLGYTDRPDYEALRSLFQNSEP